MRKFLKSAAVAGGLAFATLTATTLTSTLAYAEIQDFTFENNSDSAIVGAWIRVAGSTQWRPLTLVRQVAPNGKLDVKVRGYNESTCNFDVYVKFADGDTLNWDNVDLCDIDTLTVDA